METTQTHHLSLAAEEGCTVAECSCGQWRRQADLETVTLTGRSREEALRSAHDMHARGLDNASA